MNIDCGESVQIGCGQIAPSYSALLPCLVSKTRAPSLSNAQAANQMRRLPIKCAGCQSHVQAANALNISRRIAKTHDASKARSIRKKGEADKTAIETTWPRVTGTFLGIVCIGAHLSNNQVLALHFIRLF